jgi:hypothetical protein
MPYFFDQADAPARKPNFFDQADNKPWEMNWGYTVYGKLVPIARSLTEGALPIGLAHGVRLTRDVAAGTMLRMSDVALDQGSVALKLRREMAGKTGITSAGLIVGNRLFAICSSGI